MLFTSLPSIAFLAWTTAAPTIQERASPERVSTVLTGHVLTPEGRPADDALVMTSAGGKTTTEADGSFWIEIEMPADATRVQVTAVRSAGSPNATANAEVAVPDPALGASAGFLRLTQGGCQPAWVPSFGPRPGLNSRAYAMAIFDAGSGPELYVGGSFSRAGGVSVDRIARWNGTSWSSLPGLDGTVLALAVFDDGGGPALYAGGEFLDAGGGPASRVAKWDGTSWSPLGSGLDSAVEVLAIFDDGTGPALVAGGSFSNAGGAPASRIASWDGATWSVLGSGVDGTVAALAVHDDGGGAGPALYVGGTFDLAGGVPASRIARWDGTSWSALLGGITDGGVSALQVYDEGSGPRLFAGGGFSVIEGRSAGTPPGGNIARWNGVDWTPVGGALQADVLTMTVFDDGNGAGPALLAAGAETNAGIAKVARWDGTSWSTLGIGFQDAFPGPEVHALQPFDDGGGQALYAGGWAESVDRTQVYHLASWDGTAWHPTGNGLGLGALDLAVQGAGAESELIVGGVFTSAGGQRRQRIASWDGDTWSSPYGHIGGTSWTSVQALAFFDDGDGAKLHAAGRFTTIGGTTVNHIARWDGAEWTSLAGGMSFLVHCLTTFDDGSGDSLFAGGQFNTAGGGAVSRVARWDGAAWFPLGSGMDASVNAFAVHDDGGGPRLYAGGLFTAAGGMPANRIARWDGATWSPLGSGLSFEVLSLATFDDGGGPQLYVSGRFTSAGGSPASRIARWDGSAWSPVGSGLSDGATAMVVFDDGDGPCLYAGGLFSIAGGLAVNGTARWDGASWSALGAGVGRHVSTMASFDDGSGFPALMVGGYFQDAPESGDSFLARWQGCPDAAPPLLTCPSSVVVRDPITGTPGEVVTFSVTASDNSDPSPGVVCQPASGSLFLPGTTIVTCTATDATGNQSTCKFPVTVRRKVRRL